MKIDASIPQVIAYVEQHWFKLLLVGLLLFLFTQKDFSFSINLSDPEERQELPSNDHGQKATLKKEYFTEKTGLKNSGMLDRFDLSPFSSTPKSKSVAEKLNTVSDYDKEAYLKRFAKVVVEERRKFGIPSSVILGMAYLQSHAGTRGISASANNQFGLQCTSDWAGATHEKAGKCFRQYENAWLSFRDNSLYLSSGKFATLQALGSTDYQAWTVRLEQLGYSEYDDFAQQLIWVIEHYGLHALDNR